MFLRLEHRKFLLAIVKLCANYIYSLNPRGFFLHRHRQKARYQEEYMMELLTAFDHALFDAISTRPVIFTSEHGTKLLSAMIQLYEAIFADGRFGKWHYHIGQLYLSLASYEAARNGTDPNTSPYYTKGFKHLKQYESISQEEEYTYSAPLLSNLNPLKKGDIAPLAKEVLAETE